MTEFDRVYCQEKLLCNVRISKETLSNSLSRMKNRQEILKPIFDRCNEYENYRHILC